MKKKCLSLALILASYSSINAQEIILKENLEEFKNPGQNWSIKGDATASPFEENNLESTEGSGVLVNIHEHGTYGSKYELISEFTHGDIDIEFDFMMAKGSNSGVYLQGNYEIQLRDSWGKKTAKYNDNGGIYERWDDSQPDGEKGYEGNAPRVNASKAPGLWQNMKISFEAPKFDNNGQKTQNAIILSISLNNTIIHENVELSGVSRGALSQSDIAKGPLRFQGDHGSLAFKNIKISTFDKDVASLQNLKYKVDYSPYDPEKAASDLEIDDEGSMEDLSWTFLTQENEFAYFINGELNAPTEGNYEFDLFSSSNNSIKIDGEILFENRYTSANDKRTAQIKLTKGLHQIEIYNAKYDAWLTPALGLFVSGPGFRKFALHRASSMLGSRPNDPILIEAKTITNLRSFRDVNDNGVSKRIVHAISVGFPENIHFAYDLDKGALFQVWRGDFLDATPMWNERGDGSSIPNGAITNFNNDLFISNSPDGNWPKDTLNSSYKPKGYVLDENDIPTFKYEIYGTSVDDRISILEGNKFNRNINIANAQGALFARLAKGKNIEKVGDGLFAIEDKSWFLKLDENQSFSLKDSEGFKELIVPLKDGDFNYQILF